MGKKLIITEKPSVAQDYAKVFQVSGKHNGYIENNTYVITWCVGHLVEMVYPEEYDIRYKKWALQDLPFLPEKYKYGVIKNVKQQYDIVHALLQREDIDTVYWAGDSGKEGQTIEENIRNYGGVRKGMQELRVWIDSQTEAEIKRGMAQAKPMSAYENLGRSGIMRSIEDYAMGINFSRVMSVKYGKLLNDAAATKGYTAIAVGRVMTCVLGMVVNLADTYKIQSNRESGYGRYDVMLKPFDKGGKAFIFEFKVLNPYEDEKTLKETLANAHSQIDEKLYDAKLIADGFSPEQIRKYGFAFKGKECLIG